MTSATDAFLVESRKKRLYERLFCRFYSRFFHEATEKATVVWWGSFSTIRILTTIKAMFLHMVVVMIAFRVVFCMVVFTVAFIDVSNQRLFVVV